MCICSVHLNFWTSPNLLMLFLWSRSSSGSGDAIPLTKASCSARPDRMALPNGADILSTVRDI